MIITSVKLQDFRGISALDLPIDQNLTVIVGGNGVGKTSILDAISALLQHIRFLWVTDDAQNFPGLHTFEKTDVAYTKTDFSIRADFSIRHLVSEQNDISAFRTAHESVTLTSNYTKNNRIRHKLRQRFQINLNADYPLFVYYRQNRGFSSDLSPSDQNMPSEFTIREQSLSENLRAIPDLSNWWDKLDAQEARRHRDSEPGFKDPQLEAVRKLIEEMDEFENIFFETTLDPPGLYLQKPANKKIHVSQLSSGERVYLVLLADLARRLQIIKPDAKLAEIPGIVLIDEVELNLHPRWQRKIISTLTRIFKRCQFVVTTHSPQVVGEVSSDSIRILSRNENHEIEYHTYKKETLGRDSNEILINILGAAERDEETKSQLKELEALIGNKKLESARELLGKLRSTLGSDLFELDVAEQRLRRREGTNQN